MRPSRTAVAPSVRAVNTPARRLHPRAVGVPLTVPAGVAVLATVAVGTVTLLFAAGTVAVTGCAGAVTGGAVVDAGSVVPREQPTIPTTRQIPSTSPIPHLFLLPQTL